MLSSADRSRLRNAISLALGLALAGITLASQAKIQVLQSTYPDGTAAPAEIYLSGEITTSTTKEVTQALDRAGPKVPMLAFDSAGGDLVAAMELGDTLRRRGVNTSIGKYSGEYGKPLPGVCYSAVCFRLAVATSICGSKKHKSECTGSSGRPHPLPISMSARSLALQSRVT